MKESLALLEKAISLAYSYSAELSAAGIPSQIFTNGKDAITGIPVVDSFVAEGDDTSRRALALARIDIGAGVIPFADLIDEYLTSTGANDYIVVISPKCDGAIRPVLHDLKRKRSSMLWVMPCFRTTPPVSLESDLASNYMRWEVKGNDR